MQGLPRVDLVWLPEGLSGVGSGESPQARCSRAPQGPPYRMCEVILSGSESAFFWFRDHLALEKKANDNFP